MTKIPEALTRVQVREDPHQDEAAITEVDRSGGADIFTVVYNPELVDAAALDGYRLRAAIASSLEGFARYNRTVQQRIGSYDADELLFKASRERALAEIEELVQLSPRAIPDPDTARATVEGWLTEPGLRAALSPLFQGGEDGAAHADAGPADAGAPVSGGAEGHGG